MSYDVYLFSKKIKNEPVPENFLENKNALPFFSEEQYNGLKDRLILYNYVILNENKDEILFTHINKDSGILVRLTKNYIYFSASLNEENIFEIGMTAVEFTDKGEFIKFDPQTGSWDEF